MAYQTDICDQVINFDHEGVFAGFYGFIAGLDGFQDVSGCRPSHLLQPSRCLCSRGHDRHRLTCIQDGRHWREEAWYASKVSGGYQLSSDSGRAHGVLCALLEPKMSENRLLDARIAGIIISGAELRQYMSAQNQYIYREKEIDFSSYGHQVHMGSEQG